MPLHHVPWGESLAPLVGWCLGSSPISRLQICPLSDGTKPDLNIGEIRVWLCLIQGQIYNPGFGWVKLKEEGRGTWMSQEVNKRLASGL